jgi:predicted transcriptional regulator
MTKLEIMLPAAISGAIETLSRQTGQTQEDIVARAIEVYVDGRNRWQTDMERALEDVDRAIGHDGNAVLAWMDGGTARLETNVASQQI